MSKRARDELHAAAQRAILLDELHRDVDRQLTRCDFAIWALARAGLIARPEMFRHRALVWARLQELSRG